MKDAIVMAALLFAPAALPAGVAVEPPTTLSVTAQWLILAFAPTTVEVPVKVESLVTCHGANDCFVFVMHYSEKQADRSYGAGSWTGIQVAASAGWMPGVDLNLLGNGEPTSIRVDLGIVETSQTYGSYHVIVVFGAQPAVYNITMTDWSILKELRRGLEGVHAVQASEFRAAANVFLGASAGLQYHHLAWADRGFLGFFNPFSQFNYVNFVSAGGYDSLYGHDACMPVGADVVLIGVYVFTCPGWELRGPAGRWDFSVVARAELGILLDEYWLVWLDEAPPVV